MDHPNFIVSYAPKKLTALVVSVTAYVTCRETSIRAPNGTALYFSTLLFYCGVLLEVVFSQRMVLYFFKSSWSEFWEDKFNQ